MTGSFLATPGLPGQLTGGVLDVNSIAGAFSVSGVTGTYKIGSDFRGIVILNLTSATFTPIAGSGTATTALPPTVLPTTFAVALLTFPPALPAVLLLHRAPPGRMQWGLIRAYTAKRACVGKTSVA